MSIKDEYLEFKESNEPRTGDFADRVKLQVFLRDSVERIWAERPSFTNGGLLSNYMTRLAIGFAYYDSRPSIFCRSRCYGLPIAGLHDYYMLRLSVLTSESLTVGDKRYLDEVTRFLRKAPLECLKIGHWGDTVPEQIPHVAKLVDCLPSITFWWYKRKLEIATAANDLGLRSLRCYLSLDPTTEYSNAEEYKYGVTYLFGDGMRRPNHEDIHADPRLVAVFPLRSGHRIEDPERLGVGNHSRLCIEKKRYAQTGGKGEELCLIYAERCNYQKQATAHKAILLKREA